MQVEKYRWKISQSVELHGKLSTPDGVSDVLSGQGLMKALVVMVHGIGEHSGCYDRLAERFVAQSAGFLTFDLRGHGRSSGVRGHASVKAIKSDLRVIVKSMCKKFPDVPIVLFGHSMGGHVVLSYALDKNIRVQGIIALSPMLKLVRPPSPLLFRLARWTSHVAPWFTVRTGIKANQLSKNTTRNSKTDPLLHKRISVKLFVDLLTNSETIFRNKHRLNVPLLLMHGTADPITSHQGSQSFARNTSEYTTLKLWHGMYHDLLNDAGNEAVFQYITKWLSNKIIQNGKVQNGRKMYRVA